MNALEVERRSRQESATLPIQPDRFEREKPSTLWLPALYSIAFWWVSTGIIIYFNFQPRFYGVAFWSSFALALASGVALFRLRNVATVQSAYLSFTAASLVWAFVEVSFYTGYVVGPAVRPIFSVGPSWISFFKAVHRSLYHEALVLGIAAAMGFLFWNAKNKFGLYAFLLFWLMHQSAKLNIFLGVMNTGREFVPDSVADITTYMTIARINWLFPISVTVCAILSYRLIQLAFSAQEAWRKAGYMLTGMMAVLAWLEHWLLVLPLNQSLWDIVIRRLH
ncbi:MAG: putative photosynthetic complex assembly protein PuhE [Chloroherpetonaceae bacterium]|nr:putative photosynthetic complex assembly protein PuhE [Chloroherpetonaceae bacterium]MDW8437205.1 putative photosynthetic complex assembly protein PuhE [Chloroherpetonaceae bacterium]